MDQSSTGDRSKADVSETSDTTKIREATEPLRALEPDSESERST